MRTTRSFNDGWVFFSSFNRELKTQKGSGVSVRLPHNACDLPLDYFDERAFQKAFAYQTTLICLPEWAGKEVSLVFDGAMADTQVWVNGQECGAHKDGYTPFEARLTEHLVPGENLITVKIDGTENSEIPPFGGQIDYLTYAGIYRDVWLKITDPVSIKNVKIETANELDDAKAVQLICRFANPRGVALRGQLHAELANLAGEVLYQQSVAVEVNADAENQVRLSFTELSGLALWQLDSPTLYEIRLRFSAEQNNDALSARFGFRQACFTPDGFFLNGAPLKIRGLNRHQSFPYVGYAMGRRAQEKDAEILKKTLKCNLVRTSHYPQSSWFLDKCDELGLLVFEEIPGWQHIGNARWQDEAVQNVRRMIERDWNHPSIILWGVRINESADAHDFYVRTNQLARQLDPTRAIGGVRCIENSELLEDVYTMNDFINGVEAENWPDGAWSALRKAQRVTGLSKRVPYLVTEFNGHMFPTKRNDPEERQTEHVRRYLQVLNQAYGDPDISGSVGWCMFDYNTHNDFGSGDRVCHHGVLDMFREPKFAAYVYASQCEPSEEVILKQLTFWARGEKNRCEILPLIVLTNCDYIEFKFGDFPAKRIYPDRANYPHLPHAPVVIDQSCVALSELGEWGMRWQDGTISGFVGEQKVAEVNFSGRPVATSLVLQADDDALWAHEKDATRCIVRALDQLGNVLPVFSDVFTITLSGPARLLGPDALAFKAGVGGFWIETTGDVGEIKLTVSTPRLASQSLTLYALAAR